MNGNTIAFNIKPPACCVS